MVSRPTYEALQTRIPLFRLEARDGCLLEVWAFVNGESDDWVIQAPQGVVVACPHGIQAHVPLEIYDA